MKKSFVIFIILCLTAFGGTVFVWASLNQDKTDIQLKEKVLYGDSKEADDLVFTLQADLSDRLFWKTKHILGNENLGETEFTTDFTKDMFDESEETDSEEQKDYFQLDWGYQGEQELAAYFHVPIDKDTLRLVLKVEEEGHVSVCESNATCGMAEVISSQCIVANHAIWDKLEQVYSISADTEFYNYVVDENAHRILIHTEREGKQYLTVLSSDTGICVQTIPFETSWEEEIETFRYKDGAVLLYFSNRLVVLEEREGKYSICLDVEVDDKLQDAVTNDWDFAWKEDKLAILTGDDLGVYYVFIYDRNGLLYEGKYRESLRLGNTWKAPETFFVLYDNANMNVQWQ